MALEMRVLQVFAYTTLSRNEFTNKLGISNAVLSHLSSGRNKAGMEIVLGILHHFPEIDPDWLLFGKGEMLRMDGNQKIVKLKKEIEILMTQLKKISKEQINKVEEIEEKLNELE